MARAGGRGPLASSYPASVAMVILALVPFLLLTTAVLALSKTISASLGWSTSGFDLVVAMSDAAYAVGTVLAVQLAQHLRPRRVLLVYASAFPVASVVAASATNRWVFAAAFVAQGLLTSLMLIAAVPPLVTGWPVKRMPSTAMVMNLCIFGAVAAGPTLGELQAAAHAWRPTFWCVAGLAVLAWLFVVLTYEDDDPADRTAPWDATAVGLASAACGLAFFGAGYLQGHPVVSLTSLGPLLAGFVLVVVLVVYQYRATHPLMPVKQLATTFPVTGIVIALATSAAAIGLMELVLSALQSSRSPRQVALVFLPEFLAAVVTAAVFGRVFRTRYIPVLAFAGSVLVPVAAVLASFVVTGTGGMLPYLTTALIGLGVGASVSPALFLAGLSLRSTQIQRVFALIELLRGVTAFLIAPVLAYLATQVGSSAAQGLQICVWVCFAIAVAGAAVALGVFRLGRARLQAPDLTAWQEHEEPAWDSPALLAAVRYVPEHARRAGEPADESSLAPTGTGGRLSR